MHGFDRYVDNAGLASSLYGQASIIRKITTKRVGKVRPKAVEVARKR